MYEDKKIFIPKIGLIFLVIFGVLFFLLIREQNTLLNMYNMYFIFYIMELLHTVRIEK
jgi:hypothetical protein